MTPYLITFTTNGFDRLEAILKARTYTMALLEFAVRFPPRFQLIEAVPLEAPEGIAEIPARV